MSGRLEMRKWAAVLWEVGLFETIGVVEWLGVGEWLEVGGWVSSGLWEDEWVCVVSRERCCCTVA